MSLGKIMRTKALVFTISFVLLNVGIVMSSDFTRTRHTDITWGNPDRTGSFGDPVPEDIAVQLTMTATADGVIFISAERPINEMGVNWPSEDFNWDKGNVKAVGVLNALFTEQSYSATMKGEIIPVGVGIGVGPPPVKDWSSTGDLDIFKVDLNAGPDEEHEEDPGLYMSVNIDYDEGNKDAQGDLIPDNQPDFLAGHRIVENDDELKDATLTVNPEDIEGKLSWQIPDELKVWWKKEDKWQEVSDDENYKTQEQPIALKIEGIATGEGIITASFKPKDATEACEDKVKVNIVMVDLDVDSNNNREITDADDPIEEEYPGFIFWINENDEDIFGPRDDHPDSAGNWIDGVMDLEDFAPLIITLSRKLSQDFPPGYKYYLEIQPISGSPSIRIFPQQGVDIDYLNVRGTAQAQVRKPKIGEVSSDSNLQIDLGLFTDDKKRFIFEGISPGEYKLRFVLRDPSNEEVCRDEVYLSLRSVRNLYSVANVRERPYTEVQWDGTLDPSRETVTVFLHGYGDSLSEALSRFDRVYKRLYWARYDGDFIGLTWEGDERTIRLENIHNVNVFNALQTAEAVANFLGSLDKTVDVIAHSLGNMVVSQGLKEELTNIDDYILCQASVPGNAYDSNVPRWRALWKPGDDDHWVDYMASALPNAQFRNTYSDIDGILGVWWRWLEKVKPSHVDPKDRQVNEEWALLAYRYPGRSKCTGELQVPAMVSNFDVSRNGIRDHFHMFEMPFYDVWSYYRKILMDHLEGVR